MKRALVIALALAASAPRAAHAFGFGLSEKQDGGQAGAFLSAAASARPLALGGAYTAVADDATAPFWNASGLAQIQRYDLVTYYSRLGTDASIGSGAFALPTHKLGTFGFNVVGLRTGSFKGRDAFNQDTGEFSNDATAYLFSHGFNLGTKWAAGYTLKGIQQRIASYSDVGYGADVGVLARPHPMWQVGLALQNVIQPELKLRTQTERLPTEVRLGGRFDPISRLTLAADLSKVADRSPELSLGAEWKVSGPLALRVGANDREIAAGVGVMAGDLGLDYAFGFPHASVVRDELGESHRISFHLRFGSNVMAGSYRDLSRRREEQRREIVVEKRGGDQIAVLKEKFPRWDQKLDLETFGLVQSARQSLRQLVFQDPNQSLEAQAYIAHFQGHFTESARLFDRLVEVNPKDRRLRKHAEIARERAQNISRENVVSNTYERLDLADRRRREGEAQAMAKAAEEAAIAGGAGSSREAAVEDGGDEPPQQVAFLPPGAPMPPVRPLPPAIRPPAQQPPAVRPPVQEPVQRRPETPARPVVVPPPAEEPVEEEPAAEEPVPAPPAREEARPEVPAPVPAAPPAAQESPAAPAAPAVLPPSNRPEIQKAQEDFKQGDFVESHLKTRRLLEANPDDREAARQQMLTTSVVAAEAAITDPKETVDVPHLSERVDQSLKLYDKGLASYNAKRRDEAILLWEEAIVACPANFLARNMLSKVNEEMFNEKWDGILNKANGPS